MEEKKINIFAPFIGGILGFIVLSFSILKGFAWTANNIYPPLSSIAGVAAIVLVIAGFVFLVWKRNGIILLLGAYVWIFTFWVWCLLAVFATLGMVGVGVGIILLGIGVIPLAGIGMLISGWWALLLMFLVNLIGSFGLWFLGNHYDGK